MLEVLTYLERTFPDVQTVFICKTSNKEGVCHEICKRETEKLFGLSIAHTSFAAGSYQEII